MLSIDEAVGMYTDQINANMYIDINYYHQNLAPDDLSEFFELVEILNIMTEFKNTDRASTIFQELDQYKCEIFTQKSVSNFKLEAGIDADINDIDEIEKLFQEEFGDE